MPNKTLSKKEMVKVLYKEIADKTISQGLMVKDGKHIKVVSIVFTAGGWKDKVDEKSKDEYRIEFCGWSGDVSLNYLKETMEIIGHKMYANRILKYFEDKKLLCYYDSGLIAVRYKNKYTQFERDIGKDLGNQSKTSILKIFNFIRELKGKN